MAGKVSSWYFRAGAVRGKLSGSVPRTQTFYAALEAKSFPPLFLHDMGSKPSHMAFRGRRRGPGQEEAFYTPN